MNDDFGPYGIGTEGYIHYTETIEDDGKRRGGGRKPSGGRGSGCLVAFIAVFLFFMWFTK